MSTDAVTVAGMPLIGQTDIAQPIAAVVCIKGLDETGRVAYWSLATDALTTTEAVGMALGLLDDLRAARGGGE